MLKKIVWFSYCVYLGVCLEIFTGFGMDSWQLWALYLPSVVYTYLNID